jgi:intracellular sulfur oxidation DsrE/DsrF family protein
MAGLSTIESNKREAGCCRSNWQNPGCRLRSFFAALMLLSAASVSANTDVETLLTRQEPPHGVVFEIAEADESALEELLPQVRQAIEKIRIRFPETEFAVVSHGKEEFALQSRYQGEHAQIHQQVQALVADGVPVHVCETHAGWYGVSAEDFPEYVNVAPTGPGQIRLYEELGYELIVIE